MESPSCAVFYFIKIYKNVGQSNFNESTVPGQMTGLCSKFMHIYINILRSGGREAGGGGCVRLHVYPACVDFL